MQDRLNSDANPGHHHFYVMLRARPSAVVRWHGTQEEEERSLIHKPSAPRSAPSEL